MKKRIIALLMAVVVIATLGMVGCKKSESTSKVRIGLDDGFPPMGFRDEKNELAGFDIEVAKAVFEYLKMDYELVPIDWKSKEMELNTKKVDLLWNGYTITDKRKEQVQFSDPYLNNAQVMVVKKDSGITSLADLKGKKIALQSGSSAQDALDEDSSKELKDSIAGVNEFQDNLKAFMDLETGMSDAVLVDKVVADYYIAENNKPFVVLDESLEKEEYGIGFRKDDELCAKVNSALKDLKKNGKLGEISTKWFGSDITTIKAD